MFLQVHTNYILCDIMMNFFRLKYKYLELRFNLQEFLLMNYLGELLKAGMFALPHSQNT